jgi:hypothetical protein
MTLGFLNNNRKNIENHCHDRKFHANHTTPLMVFAPKDDPMQIDKTLFKQFMKQEKQ